MLAHLQAEIDRVASPKLLEQLDAATVSLSERIESAATRLYGALADQLALVQADLGSRAILRQHGRFAGPFRTWLAVMDVLHFGLPRLAHRLLGRDLGRETPVLEPLLTRNPSTAAADFLRGEAQGLQSLLYARGLPIDHWRTVTVQADGKRLMDEIAAALETRFEAASVASAGHGRAVVWMINALGRLVPAALVVIGLYAMGRDLLAGEYLGLPLLGHLFAMLVLSFLTLQGLASLFLTSGRRWLGPEIGRQAISEVLSRTVTNWISTYRSDLEADLANLRAPLAALQSALDVSPAASEMEPQPPHLSRSAGARVQERGV